MRRLASVRLRIPFHPSNGAAKKEPSADISAVKRVDADIPAEPQASSASDRPVLNGGQAKPGCRLFVGLVCATPLRCLASEEMLC